MGRVRIRQHVNPLSHKFQSPVVVPDLRGIYEEINQPFHLDIGCARGRFLWEMAQLKKDWNFLGLEIRELLVKEANEWRDRQSLTNLHYLFCNVNIDLGDILKILPDQSLAYVTIQFPDPWFKHKHRKRRMVQPGLVESLSEFMISGGEVFLQSDVEEVARHMRGLFDQSPYFSRSHDWLDANPLPVPTERELATYAKGEPVYRVIFQRSERGEK